MAEFVASMRLADLPGSGLDRLKLLFLDWLGVALAGAAEAGPTLALRAVRPLSAGGPATAIGHAERLDPVNAALVNGTAGHVLDFDSSSDAVYGFVSSPTIPACLAVGELMGATGEQVLEAYLAGLEVCCKVGEWMPPEHYDAGWHSTPTMGTLGAAASAAKLLRLSPIQVARTLGVAASTAGGLRQNYGTMTKGFHAGNAARNGVLAALLAREGFTASETILEGRVGYGPVFAAGGRCDYGAFERLGRPFSVEKPGIKTRRYPCCASNHRPLDALFELRREHDFGAEDVRQVGVGVVYRTLSTLMHPRATTGLEAKFSLQYCLARALLDGAVAIEHFEDERVSEPRVQALMPRIRMFAHPELGGAEGLERQFAEVTVELVDGRRLMKRVYEPRGHHLNPMSAEEIRDKFLATASRALSRRRCEAIISAVEALPCSAPIAGLTALLRPEGEVGGDGGR